MQYIAKIRTDFPDKFGIPRQSGLVKELTGRIIFEPEFRDPEAIRGIEDFSHLWLLWEFSENKGQNISLTVKPPRLGGKEKKGVFATRSPYRPNGIGLSCVKLEAVEDHPWYGKVLVVSGIDMKNDTPILDIKPYIPYADCHPEATEGFTGTTREHVLTVNIPESLLSIMPEEKRTALKGVLACDPRPAYDIYEDRVYGISFAEKNIKFKVQGNELNVLDIQ